MPGVSFGELSLMYGKPRTATVTCVKDGWLWCLERKAFRGILVDRMTHENTVKILRKVKTLKLLSMMKLQQLCTLMEEETFADDEHIVTEGEIGEKFYITIAGTVKCYLGMGDDRQEMTSIGVGGYFGEIALLRDEATKGSFVSSGSTRLLSLRRSTMEAKLGPLQKVIDQADARLAKGEALKEKNDGLAASLKKSLKKGLVEEGSEANAIGESRILASLAKPSAFIPTQLLTLQDSKCIYCVFKQRVVCDLATLLEHGPLLEATARFYLACVTSATVHLHEEGYIHRNVTPHSVYITDNGYAQLADLTCAAKIEGSKVYTMVGDPHYMAPEQISGQGYGYGVDYWALGILLYVMLHSSSPFGSDISETQVYKSIASFSPEDLSFSATVTEQTRDVAREFLEPRQEKRLGNGGSHAVTSHNFFEGIDWDQLEKEALKPPTPGDGVAEQIGDRSDPEFEREFMSNTNGEDEDVDLEAVFQAF